MKLRMGTRGSPLALAQSGMVAESLKRLSPGLEVETVVIKTSGDLFASQPPAQAYVLAEGTKGLFVKEIEEALQRGDVDLAVHSAKDLPGALGEGLTIAAYPRREDPRDVFIGRGGATLASLPAGARVATSSLRRSVQLLLAMPELKIVPMRGNVDTRLRKLEEGSCEGLILAFAGLRRLGREKTAHEFLDAELMVPSPGQGALAVEVKRGGGPAAAAAALLDHPQTRTAVEFERAFLAAMGGGCSTPLGASASLKDGGLTMRVFFAEQDGSRPRRLEETCRELSRRDSFAAALAETLRSGR